MSNLMYPNHNRLNMAEHLAEEAGDATGPPPLPKGGVPKQWLPGWIRWPMRCIALPFVWLDLGAQWFARKIIRPPFRQEGHCYQRGNCCHYILVPEPKGILRRLFYFWSTQVNGFFRRSSRPVENDRQSMVIMGCRYLQDDGRCGHYHLRPMLCRQWPLIEYFAQPRILKGCGFRAVPIEEEPAEDDDAASGA